MKGCQSDVVLSTKKNTSVNEGLVMVPPKNSPLSCKSINKQKQNYVYLATNKQHKRASSTGTTTDELSTDGDDEEEDDDNIDEPDLSLTRRKLFHNNNNEEYSTIATITDKLHTNVMHRNSSDSSVYSDETNELKEQQFIRLQNELKEANQELKQRDEELNRLSRIRQDVEAELEDLTASLFQEAHNMVRDANEKQAISEKALKESEMKVDVLSAEVAALKTLVLTSTPSHPNPHLHPQIDPKSTNNDLVKRQHRRSPSDYNLKYGRENSPTNSPVKESIVQIASDFDIKDGFEVDPVLHKEFLSWRQQPTLDKENIFIKRIYNEDINLSLTFSNDDLSKQVLQAVENGVILVEAVRDKTKAMFPKKCALLEVPRLCFYRMNLGESENWYSISQICRNRITSVCDFLNYLKYIERGLVKSSAHDIYWEIIKLRKNMVLARLGLAIPT